MGARRLDLLPDLVGQHCLRHRQQVGMLRETLLDADVGDAVDGAELADIVTLDEILRKFVGSFLVLIDSYHLEWPP